MERRLFLKSVSISASTVQLELSSTCFCLLRLVSWSTVLAFVVLRVDPRDAKGGFCMKRIIYEKDQIQKLIRSCIKQSFAYQI